MKTIIAGGRNIHDKDLLQEAINLTCWDITEVVCGGAKGVDTLGFNWGRANGIPVKTFIADWEKHGKAAGPIRNRKMAEYADSLILIWDGKSKGSQSMHKFALAYELEIRQVLVYQKQIPEVNE